MQVANPVQSGPNVSDTKIPDRTSQAWPDQTKTAGRPHVLSYWTIFFVFWKLYLKTHPVSLINTVIWPQVA